MACATVELVGGLRKAAAALRQGAHYAWGHHGSCNCGHLLQQITGFAKEDIVRQAQTVPGEWSEIAEEYCGVTELPAYQLISRLEKIGLTATDIHNLEYLEDRKVLDMLPGGFRWLKRNDKQDVILYFEAFANLLEDVLAEQININELIHRTISEQPALL